MKSQSRNLVVERDCHFSSARFLRVSRCGIDAAQIRFVAQRTRLRRRRSRFLSHLPRRTQERDYPQQRVENVVAIARVELLVIVA